MTTSAATFLCSYVNERGSRVKVYMDEHECEARKGITMGEAIEAPPRPRTPAPPLPPKQPRS